VATSVPKTVISCRPVAPLRVFAPLRETSRPRRVIPPSPFRLPPSAFPLPPSPFANTFCSPRNSCPCRNLQPVRSPNPRPCHQSRSRKSPPKSFSRLRNLLPHRTLRRLPSRLFKNFSRIAADVCYTVHTNIYIGCSSPLRLCVFARTETLPIPYPLSPIPYPLSPITYLPTESPRPPVARAYLRGPSRSDQHTGVLVPTSVPIQSMNQQKTWNF
jgi:hypothetical protein